MLEEGQAAGLCHGCHDPLLEFGMDWDQVGIGVIKRLSWASTKSLADAKKSLGRPVENSG